MWDALASELGGVVTASERSRRAKIVRSLVEGGATGADVRERCATYRERWPNVSLTDTALEKHWSMMALTERDVRNGVTPLRVGYVTIAQAALARTLNAFLVGDLGAFLDGVGEAIVHDLPVEQLDVRLEETVRDVLGEGVLRSSSWVTDIRVRLRDVQDPARRARAFGRAAMVEAARRAA